MTQWFIEFNAVFFTGIATMVFTCFAIIIKTALASKCDNLNLCFGCIKIHRRVELENPIDDEEGKIKHIEKTEINPREVKMSHDDDETKIV
jgi:hypothetical protein